MHIVTVRRSSALATYAGALFAAGILMCQGAAAAEYTCSTQGKNDKKDKINSFTLADALSCYAKVGNLNGEADDEFRTSHPGSILIDKSDESKSIEAADKSLTIPHNVKSGEWSISQTLSGFTSLWIALKAGDSYAVFELDPGNPRKWDGTFGLPTALTHGLSHALLYGLRSTSSGGNGTETPLPAALPLFATALAGVGIVTWRRKKVKSGGMSD